MDVPLSERRTIESASAYQAAFIEYGRDVELFSQLLRLDPRLAAFDDSRSAAELDRDANEAGRLYYVLGSDPFQAAYLRWLESQLAGSDLSVFDDPDYQAELYAVQRSLEADAAEAREQAGAIGARSDIMTQSTLVYAIALFLLGIAGINRNRRISLALAIFGSAVFVAGGLTTLSVLLTQ